MAAGAMIQQSTAAGRADDFLVASAGVAVDPSATGADPRAVAAARGRGIDLEAHSCRSVVANDFVAFDLMLAADTRVLEALIVMAPTQSHARIERLMTFAPPGSPFELADPWSGTADDYARALDWIMLAVDGVLTVHSASGSSNG
jgi:protein-tyrosine phosphatase